MRATSGRGRFANSLGSGAFLAWLARRPRAGALEERLITVWDRVQYGIPSSDPSAPGFDARRYWRGPSWPFMNALIAIGLREAGRMSEFERLRRGDRGPHRARRLLRVLRPVRRHTLRRRRLHVDRRGLACLGREGLMADIELKSVEKWFGATQVVKGVDLAIEAGEFIIFVGPSGCGKSTLLRMVAGLEDISRGAVWVAGRDATARASLEARARHGVSSPTRSIPTCRSATTSGSRSRRRGLREPSASARWRRRQASSSSTRSWIGAPRELSGGPAPAGRDRPVHRARSEPHSSSTSRSRTWMRRFAWRCATRSRSSTARFGATMIYVTHDQVEAMTLADRIVVLNGGEISQVGTPRELYRRPREPVRRAVHREPPG